MAECSMRCGNSGSRKTPSSCSPLTTAPKAKWYANSVAICPDMGSPGPFRGELGDASEGSIRTAALIRWPGRIAPRSSYAMFSIMDFFPTLARLAGGKVPDDRPIDALIRPTYYSAGAAQGGVKRC